jgi:hypothetical protein
VNAPTTIPSTGRTFSSMDNRRTANGARLWEGPQIASAAFSVDVMRSGWWS